MFFGFATRIVFFVTFHMHGRLHLQLCYSLFFLLPSLLPSFCCYALLFFNTFQTVINRTGWPKKQSISCILDSAPTFQADKLIDLRGLLSTNCSENNNIAI